ncbi:MAG: T9SS type A sorting domain-containing protein [Saprospiraceae bacterium]
MKPKLFPLLFALLYSSLPAQNTVLWGDSVVVASTPQPITAPRITLLKDGTPLLTWGTSGSPSQVWCTRFENGAFSTPVGVLQDPYNPSLFGFGGYDVAVSDSQVFIVFEQLQQGMFLTRSDDGGLSFGTPNLVQGPISGGYATLASVEVDGTGNPLVSYIRDKNGATYEIRRSADGGLNFQDPVTANTPAAGTAVCECCTSDMLASGDSVWLLFRNENQNLRDIWVSRSTDLATTFDTATDVDATDWFLNVCPIAGPKMARSGDSLLTVWMSGASGIGRVHLSTLHAGTMQTGQQFGFPASGTQAAQNLPHIVASGDTVGIVFVEKSKEILFHFSAMGTMGLANQSTRFAVPNHTLQYPALAFRDGVFHLVYVDVTSDKVLYRQGILTETNPVKEPNQKMGISVYPNPVHAGSFWVKSEADDLQEIILFDVFGQIIFGQNAYGLEVEVPTNILPKGVYFLKVQTLSTIRLYEVLVN